MITDGLWDAYENFHMGMTAELVAEKYNISRERQDQYAVESHRRAVDATKSGRFKDEIVPVSIPQKKGEPVQFALDESPGLIPRSKRWQSSGRSSSRTAQ